MAEYMTMPEIEAKYPNEWVFLANPTTKRGSLAPTGGLVLLHCADRAEFYRRIEEWGGDPAVQHVASWYTGKITRGLWEGLATEADPAPGVA
jgi:hypothetical protein